MRQLLITKTLLLIGGIALWCFVPITVTKAQIAPDGTLSTNVNTSDGLNFTIDNGNRAGNNLFHSFREFSVPTGGAAFFNNALDVQNIFSRVTGGNISNIDGLIRANGTANLFLINPSGILFGPNARLNIGGSFLASTANSLLFEGEREFSATNTSATSLLTINIPVGLQFRDRTAGISVQTSTLEVQPGRTLALVGGDVVLSGANLKAAGGQVELGGLGGTGTVGLNLDSNFLSLNFPEGIARTDVSITNKASIDVRAGNGGSITVNAGNLEVSGESKIQAGIGEGLGTVDAKAGDINLNAIGAISIGQSSSVSNVVSSKATGQSGDIIITAGSLSLTDKAVISNGTFGQGNAGNTLIFVQDSLVLSDSKINNLVGGSNTIGNAGNIGISTASLSLFNRAEISNVVATGINNTTVKGNAGDIMVNTTGDISLMGGSRLFTTTFGLGNAGSLIIRAGGIISLDGVVGNFPSSILSNIASAGAGRAGNIDIQATSLFLSNGAQINSSNSSFLGNAGSIFVQVSDSVSLTGTNTAILSDNKSIGNGGDINIAARSVSLNDGSRLDANIAYRGNSGNIVVNAVDSVSLSNSNIRNLLQSTAVGNGGEINITTGSLSLTNGSEITSTLLGRGKAGNVEVNTSGSVSVSGGSLLRSDTFGQGDGGKVTIQSGGLVSFDGVGINGTSSGVVTTVNSEAVGNSGDINIQAGSISLTNGSKLTASTLGKGNAGNIYVQTQDSVSLTNSFISSVVSSQEAVGNGGNIYITTGSLFVKDGSQLSASTFLGNGNAGNVTITAHDLVSFDGIGSNGIASGASSAVELGAIGNGGNVTVTANSLLVTNGAEIEASTDGKGNAGNVVIQVTDTAIFNGGLARTIVSDRGEGKGGNVDLTTGSLFVNNGSQLAASTFGNGNAGNVTINARDIVSFDGIRSDGVASTAGSTVESGAVGNGGNITVTARSLSVTNGAALLASTYGRGNAGNVTLQVDDAILLDGNGGDQFTNPSGASSVIKSGAVGNGGNVTVTTGSLSMTNGAVLLATTSGKGNAGNVTVRANNEVFLDGSFINSPVTSGAVGNGGNIRIAARSISLVNDAGIGVSTFGNGNSGNVFLEASDSISFSGDGTSIASTVEAGAIGNGGNIDIKTGSLSLTNGAQVQTLVNESSGTLPGGRGNAGDVRIEARDAVTLTGTNNGVNSAIISSINSGAVGNGGNIDITARSLSLFDNAELNTSTVGQGNAGNVSVQTSDSVSLSNSSIFSRVEAGAVGDGGKIGIQSRSLSLTNRAGLFSNTFGQGNAGDIKLENRRLILRDGAAVTAATFSEGKGGTLTVIGSESVELSGTSTDGQFSTGLSTASQGDGSAGSLSISTGRLIIRDGAGVEVDGKGKGATGNLEVRADSIRLDRGILTAESVAGDRGNIILQSQDLRLRRTSSITTNAQGIATGGNINIDTGILAALGNSDIRANAQQGSGGQVRINAQAVFGLVPRTREDLENLLNTNDPNLLDPSRLPTSDITAISQQGGPQLQGSVQIITPGVDPSSGLIELPQTIVDPDALIAQNPCTLGKGSEFIVTGRGGLPPSPSEALSRGSVRVSLVEPTQPSTTGSNTAIKVRSPRSDSLPIVPAQGWRLNEKGQLVFTAYDPTGTGSNRLGRNLPTCPVR